ncbi:putative dol-P-Man:Man(7)GlcNAc(2)-PP-Dol alpha-1,6-mannosyltransferase-like [Capsicum annuum]|uniref:PRA1 family protein n=1 Tax=Capsicum annuum TaxID=4072 RepID=A0A2G3AMA7_CAPAN|nr:putative dol-P-Man:Man(7)GlcNAc(2)-PP-Dol alpha-1,6-mannosyltransferase-like [Capsicum annuum]KAF3671327.1 putative dol-P-Man:Man(7)GlcNAc(2)-PP-Dol alpha-1,6-mannosyltransferase-like [Capsicum annuum]PHT95349.1 hypothetical protein T459_03231 [Capsicum annuum]
MASYGAAVQRPSAVSETPPPQTQPDESKQIPNPEKDQPFTFRIMCPFGISFILESAASRIINDLRKFGLYYAEFVWIVLFIMLFDEHKISVVCLVVMKEVAILYFLLLHAGANSVLFRGLIAFDTMPIVLPLLAIGTCIALIFTGAGIHLLITLAVTFPIVLAHAVLCVADDCSLNEEINQESEPFVSTV